MKIICTIYIADDNVMCMSGLGDEVILFLPPSHKVLKYCNVPLWEMLWYSHVLRCRYYSWCQISMLKIWCENLFRKSTPRYYIPIEVKDNCDKKQCRIISIKVASSNHSELLIKMRVSNLNISRPCLNFNHNYGTWEMFHRFPNSPLKCTWAT